MKPRIITLPDTFRDQLEEQLDDDDFHGISGAKFLSAQEASLRAILYPDTMPSDERHFLRDLQESLLELQHGNASPVLLFKNLPPTKGQAFSQALSRLLGNGTLDPFVPTEQTPESQHLHSDKAYPVLKPGRKSLVAMRCIDPGHARQPTVFVTADELIERWTQKLVANGHDAATARDTVIDALCAVECDVHRFRFPLLVRNPHYEQGCGAPEFFLQKFDHIVTAPPSALGQNRGELRRNLSELLDELCHTEAPRSDSGTEANTMTLYNDAIVLHGRGPTKDGARQHGRWLVAYDALPLADYRDPKSYATAGSYSKAIIDSKWKDLFREPFQR